ncbi:MAG TPA: hypothetical protein VL134_00470 [Leptolyngbya sp.]|jgi:hypothetical protein|nr:hypothetical protein [Leptolyngbya sp.]
MRVSSVLGAIISIGSLAPIVQADQGTTAIPYRCEDSVVTKKGYYFENQPDSGSYAAFKSRLGVTQFKDATAAVVDRTAASNSVLAQQQVGDRVQVCLIGYPVKDNRCNPDQDPRGRYYRIFNYRQNAEYSGTNGNHLCGGA